MSAITWAAPCLPATLFSCQITALRAATSREAAQKRFYKSIQKILALPADTRVFVGHDYLPKDAGRSEFAWETTIGEQRWKNVHIGGGKTEGDFVSMRPSIQLDSKNSCRRKMLPLPGFGCIL